jgi:pSer/pThr/pTyr-binding forkhead associated (FHA) protein
MAKLILTFRDAIVNEIPVTPRGVSVGRAPDNDVVIDNLAVSNHHARVAWEAEKLFVEDLQSLNGTFVNEMRVNRGTLKSGDRIHVGKHALIVDLSPSSSSSVDLGPKAAAPKVNETMVLDTRQTRDMFQMAAQMGERAQVAPSRMRVPSLIVVKGKAARTEYPLTNKLTVIGKSELATVRLRGWFTPSVVAQISHRDDGYYIGSGARTPIVNGTPISGQTKLNEGDRVEIGRFHFQFTFRD